MTLNLKIGVLQYDVIWHGIEENLKKAELLIEKLPGSTDIILLPEMFATGFTMQPEKLSQQSYESVRHWMFTISSKYGTAVAGTHPVCIEGNYYNRLLFCSTIEKLDTYYNKRHLFSMGEEDIHYKAGRDRKVIDLRGWKLMPLICYDLRFPVWSRNDLSYDLLFYSSNWPASRDDVWEALLKARAIENQAYVIGINRVGIDGYKIPYMGNSMIISPKGVVLDSLEDKEDFLYAALDKEKLVKFREKFPVLKDRDQFEIK